MAAGKPELADDHLRRLRALRERAARLNRTTVEDLRTFINRKDKVSFVPLPDYPSKDGDVSVATTCSGLMTLALAGELETFYGEGYVEKTKALVAAILASNWDSSGLPLDNAFTTSIVYRTLALLQDAGIIADAGATKRKVATMEDFRAVASAMLAAGPDTFRITKEYPPATTVAYWFADSLARLKAPLDPAAWQKTAQWATAEVSRQVTLLAAGHDSMIDPVAMAMGACVIARFKKLAATSPALANVQEGGGVSSDVELRYVVRLLMKKQQPSGIWARYFPLFLFPKVGANYCFTGELLEAVVNEFGGTSVLVEDEVLSGLESAVGWFEANRLEYRSGPNTYKGWNAGGHQTTLEAGKPEGWVTCVSHMFFHRLQVFLRSAIHDHVCRRLGAEIPDTPRTWDDFIPVDVTFGSEELTLVDLLKDNFANPTSTKDKKRSALLFGPPGTFKTSFIKQLAKEMELPFIAIDPSHFLREGLERIALAPGPRQLAPRRRQPNIG